MADEYSVEKIVRERRGENGGLEYLIKWKNFDKLTWEPLANLTNCKKALKAFKVGFYERNANNLTDNISE